jgi:hypothetical protein
MMRIHHFNKLPLLNQQLHRWADSQPAQSSQGPAIYQECLSQLEKTTQLRPDPLGNMPLAVVSNGVFQASRDYRKLQDQLLALSHNSEELIAAKSGHAIQLDEPEVIVTAIREVVKAVRDRSSLQSHAAGDQHRGGGPPTPATPPYVRVRIRRFEMVTSTLPRTMTEAQAI